MKNYVKINFAAMPENESFARACIASFILPLNPSLSDMSDIKTAVSEAVTNSIVHAYPDGNGEIEMTCEIDSRTVHITISDSGIGINNLNEAREPFFSTKADKGHSGMGFTVMETFTDNFKVISESGKGTRVEMDKTIT